MHSAVSTLLHLPKGFRVRALSCTEAQVQVTLTSTATNAPCPSCTIVSTRLHSHYQRRLIDVPCGGRSVLLLVQSHKWRCQNPFCVRKVFAERLTPLARVQAHMTQRCVAALQHVGVFVNGEGGVRLSQRLGITTSPTTLLRRVMDLPEPEVLPPVEIGIDDWAYRRGQRYGTIIVDHQRRRVIDLLPDREAATVATWLQAHPSLHLISRDRSREFAAAIAQGAPQTIQVLDRFHLLKNLTDLLPAILAPCVRRVRHVYALAQPEPSVYPDPMQWKPVPSRQWEAQRLAHQHERNAQYERVLALRLQGRTTQQIAHQLGMSVRTVTRWLTTFRRDTRQRKRASIFDPYASYVLARWQQGCHNSVQLWTEITQQGFTGSQRLVHQFLTTLRQSDHQAMTTLPTLSTTLPIHRYTLTQMQWLLTRFPTELRETEQHDVTWLCAQDTTIASAYQVVQTFRRLLHERQDGQLATWATACDASAIPEFQRFIRHLREEWPHAVAASRLMASNGQTEGQVNKLKLIKRQTYGRAGFALLRQRVLHAA